MLIGGERQLPEMQSNSGKLLQISAIIMIEAQRLCCWFEVALAGAELCRKLFRKSLNRRNAEATFNQIKQWGIAIGSKHIDHQHRPNS
jgi:hypothetical protein